MSNERPNTSPAARSTLTASAVTSTPMPSPGMTAIRKLIPHQAPASCPSSSSRRLVRSFGHFLFAISPLLHLHIPPSLAILIRVYLRPLQTPAEVDVDRLPFREHVQGGRAGLAMAVTGELRSAERQVDFGADRRRVDVEDAGIQIAHRSKGTVHVARIDRGRQAVLHAVPDLDCLVERSAPHHRYHRSEDLLLG